MQILDSVVKCLCGIRLTNDELIPKRVIVRDLNDKVSVETILVCDTCFKLLQGAIPKQKGKHFCKVCLKYVLSRNKGLHYKSKYHQNKYKRLIFEYLDKNGI